MFKSAQLIFKSENVQKFGFENVLGLEAQENVICAVFLGCAVQTDDFAAAGILAVILPQKHIELLSGQKHFLAVSALGCASFLYFFLFFLRFPAFEGSGRHSIVNDVRLLFCAHSTHFSNNLF